MSKNDPRYDGVNTDPPKSLDYDRIVEATDLTIRWDTEGPGMMVEIGKRVDTEALTNAALKRAEETSGLFLNPRPSANVVFSNFIHVWAEGFMFGVVFSEQVKETSLFGRLPDKNLLGATDSIVGRWHHNNEDSQQWAKRVDPKSLNHVANVRAIQAVQVQQLDRPEPQRLLLAQAATWMDGFSMGLLFHELGGHRND
ncbi:hypothetical protein ACIOEX_26130 [Streptomyces sp. NPDC087850]|uniref:hypothetical protein n=1 Tax=Streptomyces sp. NPDC087850 TaxID=3365809 RepID=UPI00382BD400